MEVNRSERIIFWLCLIGIMAVWISWHMESEVSPEYETTFKDLNNDGNTYFATPRPTPIPVENKPSVDTYRNTTAYTYCGISGWVREDDRAVLSLFREDQEWRVVVPWDLSEPVGVEEVKP